MLTLTAGMARHAGTSAAEGAGGAAIRRYLGYDCGLCNMLTTTIKYLIEHPYNVSHAGENLSFCEYQWIPPCFPCLSSARDRQRTNSLMLIRPHSSKL